MLADRWGACPRWFRLLLGGLVLLAAAGCGSGGGGGAGGGADLTVPLSARLATSLVAAGQLSAEAVVDGTRVVPLTVSFATRSVSGKIPDVPEGDHTLEIVYFINDGGTRVEVARATTTVHVTGGKTVKPPIGGRALIFVDSDHDGFTDLSELELGTDFADRTSFPKAQDIRSSKDYIVADGVAGTAGSGLSVASGRSTSAKYTIY